MTGTGQEWPAARGAKFQAGGSSRAPVFDFEGVLVVHSVHVRHRGGFEDGVELDGHAEATEHRVGVAVLGAERLVGDFETRRAVDGAVDPGHLRGGDTVKGVDGLSVSDVYNCLYFFFENRHSHFFFRTRSPTRCTT